MIPAYVKQHHPDQLIKLPYSIKYDKYFKVITDIDENELADGQHMISGEVSLAGFFQNDSYFVPRFTIKKYKIDEYVEHNIEDDWQEHDYELTD